MPDRNHGERVQKLFFFFFFSANSSRDAEFREVSQYSGWVVVAHRHGWGWPEMGKRQRCPGSGCEEHSTHGEIPRFSAWSALPSALHRCFRCISNFGSHDKWANILFEERVLTSTVLSAEYRYPVCPLFNSIAVPLLMEIYQVKTLVLLQWPFLIFSFLFFFFFLMQNPSINRIGENLVGSTYLLLLVLDAGRNDSRECSLHGQQIPPSVRQAAACKAPTIC